MSAAFLDTNVLIYAVSSSPKEEDKRDKARALLEQDNWMLSAQVLQEFYVNATRKLAQPLAPEAAERFIGMLATRDPLPISAELVLAAAVLSRRFMLSYWDAAIIAAARILRCTILYSEDLQHGGEFVGVRVVNPFR